jgi:hypothetical protein
MTKKVSRRFWCFSPPVMIATFFIETVGAAWIALRYKNTHIARLIIALLLCLAIFQLAEFFICEGVFMLPGLAWARLGYVAITMLPPLGISLAIAIAGKKKLKLFQAAIYLVAACFTVFFVFIQNSLTSEYCTGNYVIFEAYYPHTHYGLYYYSLLVVGLTMCFRWARKTKSKTTRQALTWLGIGYLAFMLPTAIVNFMDPATLRAIPSIMCGFAVLLALVLIFAVAPRVCEKREWFSKKTEVKEEEE